MSTRKKKRTVIVNKISNLNSLKNKIIKLKIKKKIIVMTNGCFDILHAGHVKLLKESKNLGDILIVAVNSDKSIKINKGSRRPFNILNDRLMVLNSISYVEYIITFNSKTPEKLYKSIMPNILTKGDEYKSKNVIGSKYVLQNNGKIIFIGMKKNRSTTSILNKIKKK